MKILIAGGSGFLGQPLASTLSARGHEVGILTRRPDAQSGRLGRPIPWTPDGQIGPWAKEVDGASAIVNLAGESIGEKRWSDAQKRRILESRVQATRSLVAAIHAASAPPAVFISGSAVGYYGPCGNETVTEDTPAGSDFLAGVCARWEEEASRAADSRTRVVAIRTGLVLEKDGGALPRMLLPFKLGVGGPVGSGSQYWPWIHRDDWIGLVCWLLETAGAQGPFNLAAPNPVTNREFARVLGRALHRPAFMPAPAFALRLMLGEMADALLLSGQRATPANALRLGFAYRYPTLDAALQAIFG